MVQCDVVGVGAMPIQSAILIAGCEAHRLVQSLGDDQTSKVLEESETCKHSQVDFALHSWENFKRIKESRR